MSIVNDIQIQKWFIERLGLRRYFLMSIITNSDTNAYAFESSSVAQTIIIVFWLRLTSKMHLWEKTRNLDDDGQINLKAEKLNIYAALNHQSRIQTRKIDPIECVSVSTVISEHFTFNYIKFDVKFSKVTDPKHILSTDAL